MLMENLDHPLKTSGQMPLWQQHASVHFGALGPCCELQRPFNINLRCSQMPYLCIFSKLQAW
jgi:hypothetical protein